MTDERSALLITEYADGLRRELTLLGASEVTDLVSEIVAMLRDASAGDPTVAAAEIDRLGPPEELARTILEQHGLATGPGTPAPSWWRLGIAAPIDIVIGLAAPAAAAAAALTLITMTDWSGPTVPAVVRVGVALVVVAVVALAGAMSWAYWRPWREGGTRTTAGMALAGVSVVRIGRTRTVALTSDLATAGLAHAHRSRAGSALTVLLAAGLLVWAGLSLTAVPTGSSTTVEQLSGDPQAQQTQVTDTLNGFYGSIIDRNDIRTNWPGTWIDTPSFQKQTLDAALTSMRASGLRSYRVARMSDVGPGVWEVTVEERRATTRTVRLTLGLRAQWAPDGPRATWAILSYEPQ